MRARPWVLMDAAWLGTRTAHPEEDPMSSSGENTPDTQADPQTHLDTDPVNAPDQDTDDRSGDA